MWTCVVVSACCLILSFNVVVIQRSLPGKQVGGISTSEAGLDVQHGHVPPAGGVVESGGICVGGAGFVLDELEEHLHVGAQSGNEAVPHHPHGVLVAGLQGLQHYGVVSRPRRTHTGRYYRESVLWQHLSTAEICSYINTDELDCETFLVVIFVCFCSSSSLCHHLVYILVVVPLLFHILLRYLTAQAPGLVSHQPGMDFLQTFPSWTTVSKHGSRLLLFLYFYCLHGC